MNTHLFVLPFLHFGVGRLAVDLMRVVRSGGSTVVAVTCGWMGDPGDDAAMIDECTAAGVIVEHADVFSRDPDVMRESARTLSDVCSRWKPVVAHAFTAVSAAAVRDCPLVASNVGWSPSKAAWQRAMDAEILEGCAVVTAVSAAVASELAAAGLRRPARLILHGVPVGPLRAPARQRIATLGAVAHLIPRKGVDVLLEALTLLPRGTFDRLRIAGEGESASDLRRFADTATLACDVDWCGHVAIDAFLPTIDALVIPSRSDALPLVLLNAMAAGVPIVASRTGGIPEALAPGEGWLVEPDEAGGLAAALADLAGRPGEARARAESAYAHARRSFSFERMAAEYAECYAAARAVTPGAALHRR
jgi:hypothetical protein